MKREWIFAYILFGFAYLTLIFLCFENKKIQNALEETSLKLGRLGSFCM